MGHRDQLGLTIHPATGAVLTAEHGPNGGDEINLILPGATMDGRRSRSAATTWALASRSRQSHQASSRHW